MFKLGLKNSKYNLDNMEIIKWKSKDLFTILEEYEEILLEGKQLMPLFVPFFQMLKELSTN
jgi:hypothetical protein